MPDNSAAAGSVNTQPAAILRIVEKRRPLPFAAIVPATPELRMCVVLTGKLRVVGCEDGHHGDQSGTGALRIGHMLLADPLAYSDDDALPAHHCAQPEEPALRRP